jgi:N-acyl-D-aspartate/D-glutamate deacylase
MMRSSLPRRRHVGHLVALVLALGAAPERSPAQDTLDVLITGGRLYDGTGGPPREGAVGIRGERIVFVGTMPPNTTARQRIDARGQIVTPGFIDPHTHAYEGLPRLNLERRRNLSSLMQGITTVVLGADGRGPLEVKQVLDSAEALGLGTNTYALTGFGTVRSRVMGNASGPATAAQRATMRALIGQAMQEGAYGVGSGLFYVPQTYASTDEVIDVVSAAKPYGGVYDTHQRDESSYSIGLFASTREAIRIGCESGLTTNIGHIKALGVDMWGTADSVLAIMRDARARGCAVVADQYPWTASGTGLSAALMPRWAQAGGRDSLRSRAADPAQRARLLDDMRDNLRRRGGDSTLLLIDGNIDAVPYLGKTLQQVAASSGQPAVETALDLVLRGIDMGVASFNMTEADIETFMRDPYVMTSSDGSDGHPRLFATYPRKLRRYVLDKPIITMERMVASASGQVAATYGLTDRGVLRAGAFADVLVFNPAELREEATYTEPRKLASGMRWVFVNGRAAVANGSATTVMAGKALRRR